MDVEFLVRRSFIIKIDVRIRMRDILVKYYIFSNGNEVFK